MKTKLLTTIVFLISFLLTSCAGYIDRVHRQLDSENSSKYRGKSAHDPFSDYRGRYKNNVKNPRTYSKTSTNDTNSLEPRTRRQYKANKTERHNANDLTDQGYSGSLWANQGQSSFLFSKDKQKISGDIVVIKVLGKLKDEIGAELKRSFPARRRSKKVAEAPSGDKKDAASAINPQAAASEKSDSPDDPTKIYDKISGVIVEEINKDYLLVEAKKEVLFRKRKHMVGVQALVNRKDISDDDSVLSSNILESTISIIR